MERTSGRNRKRIAIRCTLLVATALVFLAVAVFAKALVAKREFTAPLNVKLCAKTADGKWEVLDSWSNPGARVSASLFDLAAGKGIRSDFVANGQSGKGKRVNVRLARDGKSTADLTTGQVDLELPLEVAVDNLRFTTLLKATTESVVSPDGGVIRGKRGVIDAASRTARIGFVGNGRIDSSIIAEVNRLLNRKNDAGDPKRIVELLLVAQAEGVLKAVDQ